MAVMAVLCLLAVADRLPAEGTPPHVVLISVDTLRADRLGSYGYPRATSPEVDRLLAGGVRFEQARTVEPLTTPGLSSMLTSLYPHDHGSTRNGLRMRPGLPSLTKTLQRRGYLTGAFVGNWTLNDKISGMAEHFDHYETVFTQRRWLFWAREATATDINDAALDWVETQRQADQRRRLALWVHYVEPHGPYEFHEEFADRLEIREPAPTRKSRYDTEVAFVDARIGELLDELDRLLDGEPKIVVFTADHGESLGEHGYWGHGRHCYEPGLRIPLGIVWEGRIEPGVVEAPALIIDIPATILGLLELPGVASFQGLDWTPILTAGEPAPDDRVTLFQSHRGAVKGGDTEKVRQRGLLEVARVANGRKEILRVTNENRRTYDLEKDPTELRNLTPTAGDVSPELADWLETVRTGLAASDELPPPSLSEDDVERLRALGYLD